MNRTIIYSISPAEEGLRVEQFLRRKQYSQQDLAILRHTPGSTFLNGVPCRLLSVLPSQALLEVRIREHSASTIRPIFHPLDILYEDEDLIVVNKPSGMPTHPSGKDSGTTLANALCWYYHQQGKLFTFRCCNRLDTDTSGVIPVAKHYISASILASMSSRREIRREYLAIVEGELSGSGTIDAPLSREDGPLIRQFVDPVHGKPAVTHYRSLKTQHGHSLVSLLLETGRTHQIRVHMKSLGYPLLGDELYHSGSLSISRQALHSYRMSFPHPITGAVLSFSAPLPQDMCRLFVPPLQPPDLP